MKYYMIMSVLNNSFIGYTTDKEFLKKFLKQRGGDKYFKYIELNERQLTPKMKDNLKTGEYDMTVYQSEGEDEIFVFDYEYRESLDSLIDFGVTSYNALCKLCSLLKYIRFNNDEERDIVFKMMDKLERAIRDMNDDECCCEYDEFYNMTKIMKDMFGIK